MIIDLQGVFVKTRTNMHIHCFEYPAPLEKQQGPAGQGNLS